MVFDKDIAMDGSNTAETERNVGGLNLRRKATAAVVIFAASAAIALGVAAWAHPGDSMGSLSGKFGISGGNDACVSLDGLLCIDDNPDAGTTHNMKRGCCSKGFYTGDKGTFYAGKTCGQLGFNGGQKNGIWAEDDTYAEKMCSGGKVGESMGWFSGCRGAEIFSSCKQMLRLRCKSGVSPCNTIADARKREVEATLPESCFEREASKEQCLEDDKCKWCRSHSGSDSCATRDYSQSGSLFACTIDPNAPKNSWGCVAGSYCGGSSSRHL